MVDHANATDDHLLHVTEEERDTLERLTKERATILAHHSKRIADLQDKLNHAVATCNIADIQRLSWDIGQAHVARATAERSYSRINVETMREAESVRRAGRLD